MDARGAELTTRVARARSRASRLRAPARCEDAKRPLVSTGGSANAGPSLFLAGATLSRNSERELSEAQEEHRLEALEVAVPPLPLV